MPIRVIGAVEKQTEKNIPRTKSRSSLLSSWVPEQPQTTTASVTYFVFSQVFSSFLVSYRGFAGAAIQMTPLDTVFK